MQLTTPVKKITTSKPFCALAGVGPYAVAKANEVYEDLAVRGRRVVSKASRETAEKFEETAHELEDVSRSARQAQDRERAARQAQDREREAVVSTPPTPEPPAPQPPQPQATAERKTARVSRTTPKG